MMITATAKLSTSTATTVIACHIRVTCHGRNSLMSNDIGLQKGKSKEGKSSNNDNIRIRFH